MQLETDENFLLNENVINALNGGIFAYTIPDHKILVINETAKKIFNFNENDFPNLNQYISDSVMKDNHDSIIPAVRRLTQIGDSVTYTFKIPQGYETRIIEATTKLLAFSSGQKYILSSMIDITEKEKFSDLLQEERLQYRDALIKNSEYFYSFDANEGYLHDDIILPNGLGLVSSLGLTIPVLYDDFYDAFIKDFGVSLISSDIDKFVTRQDVIDTYNKGITHVTVEYYTEKLDEYTRNVMLFSKDKNTEHIKAFVVSNNITEERKRAIDAERKTRSQHEISNSFASIYFASWLINLKDKSLSVLNVPNFGYSVTSGKQKEVLDMAIKNFLELFVSEDSKREVKNFLDARTIGTRIRERNLLTCDYKWLSNEWRRIHLIPIKTETGVDYKRLILALQNVTAEKLKEEMTKQALVDAYNSATRANKAKTEFLSQMSHDIRTPMNAIVGMTAIAGTHLDDRERVQNCLSKITVASKHLLDLINEVLDMSKIESGRIDLQVEAFSLPDLLETLITISKPQAKEKNHDFKIIAQDIKHENVVGDMQRLQQAFMNLISNSIKYTPNGGKITLSVREKPTNKQKVGCYEFVIEDNGIGMKPEYLIKLFEPFSRAEDERVAKIQGTGLGMAITRNIIQMMNGSIKVESELNKGTKITVTIILELQDSDTMVDMGAFVDLPVLVADDDQIACESTCLVLDELGLKSEWVLSGKEAVAKVIEHHENSNEYFAVIVDWKMPEMDGVETTRKIRAAVGKDVPIVIISAYDWSDIETEAREAGANAFIAKPIFKSKVSQTFLTLTGKKTPDATSANLKNFSQDKFKGIKVLLVEDNEINAEIAKEIFGMNGLDVDIAWNGKEAVEKFAASRDDYYKLIFMDIQMPVMDGYEATTQIRKMSRSYAKTVPIIAMSANAFVEDMIKSKQVGMNEHIAKPLDFGKLLEVLNKWAVR